MCVAAVPIMYQIPFPLVCDMSDAFEMLTGCFVAPIPKPEAAQLVVQWHYLHRRPGISFAFALHAPEGLVGVVTFGVPASRHLQMGACPSEPNRVLELNRLWVHDSMPRNSESWFVARALHQLPPHIVISYADTLRQHYGYVYRALNFHYAGWTDMERKTPRFDYIVPGRHTRDAFRGGVPQYVRKVRRAPKVKYWTVTGTKRERRDLDRLCGWPRLDWRSQPPPVYRGPTA